MKIEYKNSALEKILIAVSGLAVLSVAATFVMLYGFKKPVLDTVILYIIQIIIFAVFLTEKIIRFFNAESKKQYIKLNWFEIPLLSILFLAAFGAGRWFAILNPGFAVLVAVDIYLVLQVISKLCRSMVSLAATGRNPAHVLLSVFLVLIVSGSGLLLLPRFHNLQHMNFTDAVFTAASATCVTGLVVKDTGTDFSILGQMTILSLIQLGGLGIVIFGAVTGLLLGQAMSLRESVAMQDLLNAQTLNRLGKMIVFIFVTTLIFEAIGAVSLYPMWDDVSTAYTTPQSKWFCSIFHSVSAFCNAGFSLFGRSLIDYRDSFGVYGVIAPLIVLGGLGFGVIYNLFSVSVDRIRLLFRRKFHPSVQFLSRPPERISLQSKIVLSVSFILIFTGTLALLLFERFSPDGSSYSSLKIALFQSITARTAGFNTIDISALSEASQFVLIILMFIGGSPGSTAGGIKTVTFAVIIMIAYASFHKRRDVELFGRSIRLLVVGRAVTVMLLFVFWLLFTTSLLVITEHNNKFTFMQIFFEAASALGTVGLTTGITPALTTAGKWVIIITMLVGRLGPLTLLAGLAYRVKPSEYEYPSEPVVVG